MSDVAGLIFNDSLHYLDHLAPFCALYGYPLILCESALAQIARTFYPSLDVVEQDYRKLDLPATLIACEPRCFLKTALPRLGDRNTFWLPHGYSDKGWKGAIFEPLENESVFVYGQTMIDAMLASGISPRFYPVGNFRLAYWRKHRLFYQHCFPFPQARCTYLYAPTWDDAEQNGTLWKSLPALARALPSDCLLAVKTHPNTERAFLPELERLKGLFASRENIVFFTETPCIYPLIDRSDIYIGDISSIGYDFLYTDRPLFFIRKNKKDLPLFSCGVTVSQGEEEKIFTPLCESEGRQRARKEMYERTFTCDPLYRNRFPLPRPHRSLGASF